MHAFMLLQASAHLSACGRLCLQEHERVVGMIATVVKPLLRLHLDDLDNKIQPGMSILTWTSMNIDGYLHHIYQVWRLQLCMPVLSAVHPVGVTCC